MYSNETVLALFMCDPRGTFVDGPFHTWWDFSSFLPSGDPDEILLTWSDRPRVVIPKPITLDSLRLIELKLTEDQWCEYDAALTVQVRPDDNDPFWIDHLALPVFVRRWLITASVDHKVSALAPIIRKVVEA